VIRRVRLAQWRAYEELELDLTTPVTFVVAPNGVGKTSLVEAVRWGLFGGAATDPGVRATQASDRGRVVRLGADAATVGLDLRIGGSDVTVTRTVTAAGRTTFTGARDGAALDEAGLAALLAEAWAAEPGLLRTLLFGEAGSHTSVAFPIRDHLAEVFGIAPLLDAVVTVEGRLRAVGAEIRQLRARDAAGAEILRAAGAEVERLAAEAADAEAAVTAARAVADERSRAAGAAAAWDGHRAALAAYQHRITELGERLATVVDTVGDDPETLLARLEEDARDDLEHQRGAVADARVEAAASGSALDLLGDGGENCPTCLRPLSTAEREDARAHHQRHRGEAEARAQAGRDAARAAEARLDRVRAIHRELRTLRVPVPPEGPDPGPGASAAAAAAHDALLAATRAHGAAVARADDARTALAEAMASVRENAALVAAYREEALLEIHRAALAETADRYLTGRIEPLAAEVARRWKVLFGSDGLQFDHDGSLRLRVGDDHLDLADLSGGERVVAFFVTRLLVVASATRATTLWLDEPLEHLDPRRRAAVAATIVRAAQQGALDQIVVTTYEERLARQLAASAPELVTVAHVRATPPRT
jgi:DNA repair exonuclease SbcCD ATPase subunit